MLGKGNVKEKKSLVFTYNDNSQSQGFTFGDADWQLTLRNGLTKVCLQNLTAANDRTYSYKWKTSLRIAAVHPETCHLLDLFNLEKVVFSRKHSHISVENNVENQDEYLHKGDYKIFISFENSNIMDENIANLNTNLFQSALNNGDVSILCKDDKIVKADRIFLSQNPFFKSLFHFKENQVSDNDPKTADLSQFDEATVTALVQFLYTYDFVAPESLESRVQLFKLAEYTLAESLKDVVVKLILKEGYDLKELLSLAVTPI